MLIGLAIQTVEQENSRDSEALEQLLAGVAAGEREALAGLYRRTRAAVYAMALSCLKNPHDAQDVTQDTFVQVWDNAHQYRPQGSPMAWLLTITRNLAGMKLRREGRLAERDGEEWDAIPAGAPGVTPEDRHLLQEALAALGEEERQIVLLHAVTGLKHRETAALLRLPLPTVLSKYRRALKKLRLRLEGDDAQ